MLEDKDIERLERRATNATQGYSADENITIYTYGRDVTALLNERRELLDQVRTLERHLKDRDPLNMPADGYLMDKEKEESRKVKK